MDREQILIEEWKEIRETLRYFGNKRFAQLTVFIAATGFMINYFFAQTNRVNSFVLQLMGSLFSLLFLLMERRSREYWKRFQKRGNEIEDDDNLLFPDPPVSTPTFIIRAPQLMHRRPTKRGINILLTGTWLTYILYGAILLFWLTSFFWHKLHIHHWR